VSQRQRSAKAHDKSNELILLCPSINAGASPTASMPASSTSTYTTASNQLNTSTMASAITYDAAGDVTYDGTNHYLYDAEGRICAVENASNVMTGYIYDASGIRVAKGSPTSFSCNFASNGYATTTSWVPGPGGEQVTEYSVSGTTSTWVHTNAFASGVLLASYHDTDTYFALTDWLGTRRAEISAGGQIANYRSLAYGNGLVTIGSAPDATELHFTGKERDTESGNDYFDARYYSSNLGRFMSPDWSAKEEPVPYARLREAVAEPVACVDVGRVFPWRPVFLRGVLPGLLARLSVKQL